MTASNSPNGTPPQSSPIKGSVALQPFIAPSQSKSDWLATSIASAKVIAGAAECLPFPYVQVVFKAVIVLLETVEQMKQNQLRLRELCDTILEITAIIQAQISSHGDKAASSFKEPCERFENILQEIRNAVIRIRSKPVGFGARLKNFLKEFLKSSSIAEDIDGYRRKVQELRENFMFDTTLRIGFGMEELLTQFAPVLGAVSVPQKINTCPPPSRIFQGRQIILDKMEQYFFGDSGNQPIFLLHGLGGAGKTQTALKFLSDSSSRFSNIFMVDTSTFETIESGLKNIAAATSMGTTSKDALEWLASKAEGWLLFFDNADDPKINLNQFFPQCTHGNILITSRNPGLRVYSGEDSLVSDMEERDAVNLLLRSASVECTDDNEGIAAEIVKALYCLPLAIIQAGAFIAKSGALRTYLKLYEENRARLLSEKPTQVHDDYAWTVYTTWQISFDQLSKPAATLLQLCSFLHYQGISEKIFKNASGFEWVYSDGPSEEECPELQQPLTFLSQFRGTTSSWDSLYFMDITNELRAYSLINFDVVKEEFSFHPLVHHWAKNVISDQGAHDCISVILGMAIAEMSSEDLQLESLKLAPHIDAVLQEKSSLSHNFQAQYAKIYNDADRDEDALRLNVEVLEKRRKILGDDHLYTLLAMEELGQTYSKLYQTKTAKELALVVFDKRRKILGDDHLYTVIAMESLGLRLLQLVQYKEAEELLVVALEKQRKILGDDNFRTQISMRNMAVTFHKLGRYQEAKELQIVVLDNQRKMLGDNSLTTLITMETLASTYSKLGQTELAEELQLVVLEKRRNIRGDDHPETLFAMTALAEIYAERGDLKEAEELWIDALEKRRRTQGKEHRGATVAMQGLASVYQDQNRFKEAEDMQIVIVESWRKIEGDDHPITISAMSDLVHTFCALEKFKEAEKLQIEVLARRKKRWGADHSDTLLDMHNLADIYSILGQWKEAYELRDVVLEKQREILGDDHPDTKLAVFRKAGTYCQLQAAEEHKVAAFELQESLRKKGSQLDPLRAMTNQLDIFNLLGQYDKASKLSIEILEKQKETLGDDHADTLCTMSNLAILHTAGGEFKEAAELLIVVLEKKKNILGDDHLETLSTMSSLADVHTQLKKYKEAEELQTAVLKKLESIAGQDDPFIRIAMQSLVHTYTALGKITEAEAMHARLRRNH